MLHCSSCRSCSSIRPLLFTFAYVMEDLKRATEQMAGYPGRGIDAALTYVAMFNVGFPSLSMDDTLKTAQGARPCQGLLPISPLIIGEYQADRLAARAASADRIPFYLMLRISEKGLFASLLDAAHFGERFVLGCWLERQSPLRQEWTPAATRREEKVLSSWFAGPVPFNFSNSAVA